jgi:hypothetical protein
MKIDWVQEFEKKFSGNQIISSLEKIKFHGKLEINFADGVANTCHVNWCVKPYSTVTLTETSTRGGGMDG